MRSSIFDGKDRHIKEPLYRRRKASVREFAQRWQAEASERHYSYGELEIYQQMFQSLGKRYCLTKEFRENGLI